MNIDWNRINSFITEGDAEDEKWLKEMVLSLISNYEEHLLELVEIIEKKDNYKLAEILHQMKGICSNFGMESLRQITLQAEIFSKANNMELSLQEVSKLEPIWQETKAELKSKLGI